MKNESKCRRATIDRDTWNQGIHKPKGHWIRNQEKDKRRVEGKFHFQTSR